MRVLINHSRETIFDFLKYGNKKATYYWHKKFPKIPKNLHHMDEFGYKIGTKIQICTLVLRQSHDERTHKNPPKPDKNVTCKIGIKS